MSERRRRPRAKRSLGQNFLIDPNLQRKIVALLEAEAGDAVLEVGPGHGELTRHLVDRVDRIVVVEKDRRLAAELRGRWGDSPSVEIVEGDALELDLAALAAAAASGPGRPDSDLPPGPDSAPSRPLRVVSNMPYNITSPLLFALLAIRPVPRRLVVTVQREVAERVVAAPGSRTYGALSVGVQAVARARLELVIGREAFRPRPDVESAVLRIDPDEDAVEAVDAEGLRELTRALFGRRRKQLQKILKTAPELGPVADPETLLRGLGIDPALRPEDLPPSDFLALRGALAGRPG